MPDNTIKNRQIVLAARPEGWVKESDFRLVESKLDPPAPGQVLVKNLYLSLDPYMRGRMNATKSYAAHVEIGQMMVGSTVGEIVEANDNPHFKVGDRVLGNFGWQEYALSDGRGVLPIQDDKIPLTAHLGAVGMPGITAWVGLIDIGQPKAGETVVVSAASGAVGSVVGKLAKQHGCRAVGIAGGPAKCEYLVNELGFDAYIDYKTDHFYQDLKEAVPDGIDIYFDNVGGAITDAVLTRLNSFARIPLCGVISQYNETKPRGIDYYGLLLTNRVRLEGFIVSERMKLWPTARAELYQLYTDGKLKYSETIAEGLESAPRAFIGMLKGENFGKQLVKLA